MRCRQHKQDQIENLALVPNTCIKPESISNTKTALEASQISVIGGSILGVLINSANNMEVS